MARSAFKPGGRPSRTGFAPGVAPIPPADTKLWPLAPPEPGLVRIGSVDRLLDLVVPLDAPPKFDPGVAKLTDIDLAWRTTGTSWSGQTRPGLLLSVMFDGYPRRSVEPDLRTLKSMATPTLPGRATGAPRRLQVAGAVPGTDLTWMIVGVDELNGLEDVIWRGTRRVRQRAVITLTEWEPIDRAETVARKNQRTAAGARKPRGTVTVRSGDTLQTIAAETLGSGSRWKEIADANPRVSGKKRTPRRSPTDVKVGEKLRIPT